MSVDDRIGKDCTVRELKHEGMAYREGILRAWVTEGNLGGIVEFNGGILEFIQLEDLILGASER